MSAAEETRKLFYNFRFDPNHDAEKLYLTSHFPNDLGALNAARERLAKDIGRRCPMLSNIVVHEDGITAIVAKADLPNQRHPFGDQVIAAVLAETKRGVIGYPMRFRPQLRQVTITG